MVDLKTAFDRNAKALKLRPSLGRNSATTTAKVRDGLVCEIDAGAWHFTTDMPAALGGTESAPTPGVYGRAALASCLATSYVLYAAKLGVPIGALEVEVQTDYDHGAMFGVSDSPPGYLEVRYLVRVQSGAAEAEVLRVLDEADAHSPYLDVFSRAQRCVRTVQVAGA
jgi:uncharacterized OsmC-like protein